jgi:hypothetical protein
MDLYLHSTLRFHDVRRDDFDLWHYFDARVRGTYVHCLMVLEDSNERQVNKDLEGGNRGLL